MDKLAHVFAGGFIAAAILPFGAIDAIVAVAVAALVREVMGDVFDALDLAATLAGGGAMIGWLSLV